MTIPFGSKAAGVKDRFFVYRKVFELHSSELNELKSNSSSNPFLDLGSEKKENPLFVHLRFFSLAKKTDMVLGCDAKLCINNRSVNLSKSSKKIRTKNIQEPFVTYRPIDATKSVTQRSLLSFLSPLGYSGHAVVQLVREQTTQQLIDRIPHIPGGYQKADLDKDIEETKVMVSLRCPLGYCKIVYPCKGIRCSHLQCFDARFFLEYSRQQRVWQCPVCALPIPYSELVFDEYFYKILESLDDADLKVTVNPDGSFCKVGGDETVAKKAKKKKGKSSQLTAIMIEDDESDQGEGCTDDLVEIFHVDRATIDDGNSDNEDFSSKHGLEATNNNDTQDEVKNTQYIHSGGEVLPPITSLCFPGEDQGEDESEDHKSEQRMYHPSNRIGGHNLDSEFIAYEPLSSSSLHDLLSCSPSYQSEPEDGSPFLDYDPWDSIL